MWLLKHTGGGYIPEHLVKKYDAKNYDENDAIIISVKNHDYFQEIMTNLQDATCDIYVDFDLIFYTCFIESNLIRVVDKGIKNNQKFFLLSDHKNFVSNIKKFLNLFDVEIINADKYDIDTLYDYLNDLHEKFIVMIDEFDDVKRVEILNELEILGFRLANNNVVSLNPITRNRNFLLKRNVLIKDFLVGHAAEYGSLENHGYKIFGNSNSKLKIVIYGGSTSTFDLFDGENWTSKLYKKLNAMSFDCSVYTGAAGGYRVIHEFLRYLRDGHILKPDIVISMCGVNDAQLSKLNNKFNLYININDKKEYNLGYPSSENCYAYWLRVEKMFKMYVESLNGVFFPFLQPMNLWMPDANLETKMQCEYEGYINGNKDYLLNVTNDDIYTNLIGLFHNQPEMFVDDCHYSDKGADILSDKVLETILPTIKEIYARK